MSKLCFIVPPFTRELKVEQRLKVDFLEAEVDALRKVVSERQSAWPRPTRSARNQASL